MGRRQTHVQKLTPQILLEDKSFFFKGEGEQISVKN